MSCRCCGIMWYFGLLAQVAFSQHQAPDPSEKPENAEASAPLRIAKMLEGQAIVNRWLASLNYHVLGLCVILCLIIGVILMIRRGARAFHFGWFLYGKPPRGQVFQPAHVSQHPKSWQAELGAVRQIYGFTFLQNVPLISNFTFGQLTLSSFFVGLVVILAVLSNPAPTQNPRRFGYLAAANIPFLVLFSMKNSPLALLGKGYEKLNFIHRFIGFVVIACSLIHGGLMTSFMSQGKISNTRAFYSGCFMGFMLLLVGITAIPAIRRRIYKIFYIVHVLGYLSLFAGGIYHEKALRPYMISAISLHLLSSGWQVLKWKMYTATLTPLPGKITRVEINGIKTGWKAGHHVRLRVLGSFWQGLQAHPFTIASAPSRSGSETNSLILYVKAVGSFTTMLYAKAVTVDGFSDIRPVSQSRFSNGSQKLVQLPSDICSSITNSENKSSSVGSIGTLQNSDKNHHGTISRMATLDIGLPDGVEVNVHVEGPYGGIGWHGLDEFRDVIICAGGSGISFLVAVVSELVSLAKVGGITKRALVIFTVRDWEVAKYFGNILARDIEESSTYGLSLDVRFFVTVKVETPIPLGDIKIRWQRPSLDVLVKEFLMDVVGGQGVGLGACGPPGLMAQVRSSVAMIDLKTAKRVGGINMHFEELGW
ncbi:Ferric reductase like transmembrane component [Puccinia graminis f. sp. tritici]|uniref:ferric-chelate reductase (NADPH) n=1 Tax=Puccinia graminis f. sp. tritici TaxID=56615 RepID=A0A5B0PZK1_PUCGR|nr:Ferric reductase like transmembrane component [Puccinia graminis f. sp. tritici]KAA1109297.1 Ferric reductase like transmembrane component [Puccinia graminis f. sp. tritici]